MGRAFTSRAVHGARGVEIYIDYNDNNLRLQRVNWSVADGVSARMRVWEDGTLVYDNRVTGPASGRENVPGSHTMVERDGGAWLDLPAYMTYQVYTTNA